MHGQTEPQCRYSQPSSPHKADAGFRICQTHKSEWHTYCEGGRKGPWRPSIVLGEKGILEHIPAFLRVHNLKLTDLVARTAAVVPELGMNPNHLSRESIRWPFPINGFEVEALYLLAYWADVLDSGDRRHLDATHVHDLARKCFSAERARAMLTYPRSERPTIPAELMGYMADSTIYSAAVSYPFLESAVKLALSNFVKMDGTVLTAFPKKQGNYSPNSRCSNVRDLLVFLISVTSGLASNFRAHVKDCLASFDTSGDPVEGAERIYRMRNRWSHGDVSWPYGQRVGLLACLVLSITVWEDYEDRRRRLVHELHMTPASADRSGHYPPLPDLWHDLRFMSIYLPWLEAPRRQPPGVYIPGDALTSS